KGSASGAIPRRDRPSSTSSPSSRTAPGRWCTVKTQCRPWPAPASRITNGDKTNDHEFSESPVETAADWESDGSWPAVQICNERDPGNLRRLRHRRAAGVLRADGACRYSIDCDRKSVRLI